MVVPKFRWADIQLFFEDPIEMALVVEPYFICDFPDVQIGMGQKPFGFIDSNLIDIGFKVTAKLFVNDMCNPSSSSASFVGYYLKGKVPIVVMLIDIFYTFLIITNLIVHFQWIVGNHNILCFFGSVLEKIKGTIAQ